MIPTTKAARMTQGSSESSAMDGVMSGETWCVPLERDPICAEHGFPVTCTTVSGSFPTISRIYRNVHRSYLIDASGNVDVVLGSIK